MMGKTISRCRFSRGSAAALAWSPEADAPGERTTPTTGRLSYEVFLMLDCFLEPR